MHTAIKPMSSVKTMSPGEMRCSMYWSVAFFTAGTFSIERTGKSPPPISGLCAALRTE